LTAAGYLRGEDVDGIPHQAGERWRGLVDKRPQR
jgi:hypothetical protein